MPNCAVCGHEVDAAAGECPSCGAKRVTSDDAGVPPIDRPERWGWVIGQLIGAIICLAVLLGYLSEIGSDDGVAVCFVFGAPLFVFGAAVFVFSRWMGRKRGKPQD